VKIKVFNKILFFIITLLIVFPFSELRSQTEVQNEENVFVVLRFKTQPEKESEAISAFNNLINEVTNEPNFVNIQMLVDPADNTNIMLYEEWSNESYFKNEHMNTPHLRQFQKDSEKFLAGPPDITFWKLNQNYRKK
jgi:quinol monooxygenase YgiN